MMSHIESAEDYHKGTEDSGNLYEDWLKSPGSSPKRTSSLQTIVIKSVAQSYQGFFKNIYIEEECGENLAQVIEFSSPFVQSTAMSLGSPKDLIGSTVELKDLSKTFYGSIVEQVQESDKEEELSQIYCNICKKNTFPIVSVRLKEMGIITSVKYFFDSFRCCRCAEDLKEYHEYVYSCGICKNLVKQIEAVVK